MQYTKFEYQDYIATITIDNPKALNALSSAVLDDINAAMDHIKEDTRVVIFTGAGEKSFVAGADISEMANYENEQGYTYSKKGHDLFVRIEQLPMPTIAAINGYCLGGGMELAMACDIRLASNKAIFGQPEVGLGITPGFGGTARMARLIGLGKAKQLIFTAQNIKAPEAYRIGLVEEIYEKEEFLEKVKDLATTIAKNAPIAVRNAKKSISGGIELKKQYALMLEQEMFSQCFDTQDQKSGMQAFLEKKDTKVFENK